MCHAGFWFTFYIIHHTMPISLIRCLLSISTPPPPPPTQRHKRKLRNSCLDLSLLAPTAGRLTLTFLSIFWNETVLISRNDNGNRKPYAPCWLLVSSELRSTITSWPSFVLCIQNKISIWYDIKWVYNITTLYQGGGASNQNILGFPKLIMASLIYKKGPLLCIWINEQRSGYIGSKTTL